MSGIPYQCNLPDRDRDSDIEAELIMGPGFAVANQWGPNRQVLVILVGWVPGYRCRKGCHTYSPTFIRRLRGGRQAGSLLVTTT